MLEDDKEEELPKMLDSRVREAQLSDETCNRVIVKLQKGEQQDKEVTLAYATDKEGSLFIDNKLQVPELIRTKVI